MKILITGGAGFIGSEAAKALVKKGYDIISYDFREDTSSLGEIKDKIQIIKGDIRDFEHVRRAVIGCDGIIHLAAVSRVIWGYENPKECVDINITGTSNVLEAARTSVKKPWIIFGGSREVYGEADVLPAREGTTPIKIHNVYGATKIAAEYLAAQYHKNYGINGIILRFSNVYGTKYDQLDRVTPKFILRAGNNLPLQIDGGRQSFDFTHISDTVQAIELAVEKLKMSDKYFNNFHVTTGVPTSLQQLVEYVKSSVKTESEVVMGPARIYDVEKFYADPSKIKKELGYEPKVDIQTGVRLLAEKLLPKEKLR